MCITSRRNPASANANQGPKKDGLVLEAGDVRGAASRIESSFSGSWCALALDGIRRRVAQSKAIETDGLILGAGHLRGAGAATTGGGGMRPCGRAPSNPESINSVLAEGPPRSAQRVAVTQVSTTLRSKVGPLISVQK